MEKLEGKSRQSLFPRQPAAYKKKSDVTEGRGAHQGASNPDDCEFNGGGKLPKKKGVKSPSG